MNGFVSFLIQMGCVLCGGTALGGVSFVVERGCVAPS
jgi:hypothetical protein